jgi:DNA-binding NtrC family response regulator
MTNQTQNIFIVEDNQENVLKLHQFLEEKFGKMYAIFTYSNAVQALEKVDENTSLIVLKNYYFGDEGSKIINFIKNINQKTKVIVLSKTEDINKTIDSYLQEINKQVLKKKGTRKKLSTTVFDKITYPAQYLQERYSMSQAFIYTVFLFIIISIIVFIGFQFI